MWTPAAASVVARLWLHEGFGDVSFRVGGRRGWKAIGMALVFPIIIGLVAYGIAWATGLVQFNPKVIKLAAGYIGETASPIAAFMINIVGKARSDRQPDANQIDVSLLMTMRTANERRR
jgi:hypothetical protein